jgi:hypothetical protein
MRRSSRRAALLLALVATCAWPVAAPPARAVILRSTDGAAAASDPARDAALANAAVVAGLSGVYLGRGWLLTARHVLATARSEKKTDVVLGGALLHLRPDTEVPLTGGGGKADLALVRLDAEPALPSLPITSATPAVGTRVVMIGNGPLQETKRTCWDASGREAPAATPGVRCGFKWWKTPEGKTNGVQWGTNQVALADGLLPGPNGARTRVFATVFRDGGATPREAQAGVGDSGGPVFLQRGHELELAGILLGVSSRAGNAALFGDQTFAADLSVYRSEILQTIGSE